MASLVRTEREEIQVKKGKASKVRLLPKFTNTEYEQGIKKSVSTGERGAAGSDGVIGNK